MPTSEQPPQQQPQTSAPKPADVGKVPTRQDVAQLAATLEESEERLRLAVEAGGMGVWQIDLVSNRSTWWPGMERLHGLPPGSPPLHGEAYFEAIDPIDRDQVRAAIRDAIVKTGWHRVEYRVHWPDGRVRWIEARGRVRRDDAGKALSLSGVCVDITRRKHVEYDLKFLAEASAELASVDDYPGTLDRIARLAVPRFADWCAVDIQQPDGSLRRVATAHVDPGKERLLHEMHERYPPDPLAPVGTWHVLRTGRGDLVPEISDEMVAAGAADEHLREMLRQLGIRSYIGAPLNTRGRTLGVLTFITSRSGRRYGADDLALAEDLARRAAVAIDNAQLLAAMRESDRAKDVFLATLAHELRNPLAPIWNGLSLIKRASGDPHRIEQVSGIIERQVGQLSRLVDDLLDVSRITTGKIELKKEPTNLVHVINAAVEVSRPHIEAAHHQLSIAFPDAPTDLVADAARLTQVFSNLLNNAAKYTRRGGRITVAVEALPQDLVVRVRDNGIGIAPEMLRKVFGLFTQATRPDERHHGGLGIGLSLVEGLVRLHGGQVEAHSAGPDQGSEFVVILPRHRLESAAGAQAGSRKPAAAPAHPPTRRVLVVDDNEDAASTVAELLKMGGNEVVIAHDGAGAVACTAEFRPDVVLLDIGLPDISGYEVARRIRKLEGVRQPMLVALTGWGQPQDKEAAAQAGFDQHWTKPVDPQRLQELSVR